MAHEATTAAFARLLETFGRTATYLSPAGVTTTGVTCLVQEAESRNENQGERKEDNERLAVVSVADTLTPVKEGSFTIGTEVWIVNATPQGGPGFWRCPCRRLVAHRVGERRQQLT